MLCRKASDSWVCAANAHTYTQKTFWKASIGVGFKSKYPKSKITNFVICKDTPNFVKIRVHIPSCANSLALWEI